MVLPGTNYVDRNMWHFANMTGIFPDFCRETRVGPHYSISPIMMKRHPIICQHHTEGDPLLHASCHNRSDLHFSTLSVVVGVTPAILCHLPLVMVTLLESFYVAGLGGAKQVLPFCSQWKECSTFLWRDDHMVDPKAKMSSKEIFLCTYSNVAKHKPDCKIIFECVKHMKIWKLSTQRNLERK